MRKSKMICSRCSDKEYDRLMGNAIEEGLSLSEYVLKSSLNRRSRAYSTKKDRARTVVQMQMIIDEAEVNAKMSNMAGVEDALMKLQKEMDEVWKQ